MSQLIFALFIYLSYIFILYIYLFLFIYVLFSTIRRPPFAPAVCFHVLQIPPAVQNFVARIIGGFPENLNTLLRSEGTALATY